MKTIKVKDKQIIEIGRMITGQRILIDELCLKLGAGREELWCLVKRVHPEARKGRWTFDNYSHVLTQLDEEDNEEKKVDKQ